MKTDMDADFPVKIKRYVHENPGPLFESHWHEQFQILYFEHGEALIRCNSRPFQVKQGDVVITNKNDVHYGESLSQQLVYHLIKLDLSFLFSRRKDVCQTKYWIPLLENQVLFNNYISEDEELICQIRQLIGEYIKQETGFELAVKACLYRIIVLLLRNHKVQNNVADYDKRHKTMLIKPVLEYIDQHYCEKLSLRKLAAMTNVSNCHFCRVFKKVTGKPPIEYINYLRINRAIILLQETNLNVSEVAMAVGFDDSNYFSRLFKKYKHIAPSQVRMSW